MFWNIENLLIIRYTYTYHVVYNFKTHTNRETFVLVV